MGGRDDFRLVRSIFLEAMRRPPQARTAYLDAACAGVPAIRREVEELIAASATPGEDLAARIDEGISEAAASALAARGEVPDALPARIGPYRIVRHIATGGMGVVYEAEDPRLHRRIALKTLTETLAAGSTDALARLEREARLLASLNHPNIATLHSLEEADGVRFLTMELIVGPSLGEILARGPMSVGRALAIARRIARALEAAHEAGIVHRDLKPSNVMLGGRGEVKVLDFGIARRSPRTTTAAESAPTALVDRPGGERALDATAAGSIAGTPGYMSPEQRRGEAVDARSDIFAYGCLLYECLTGRRALPATGERPPEDRATERSALDEERIAALPDDLPEPVRALVVSCTANGPASRPATMKGIRRTLQAAIEERQLTRLTARHGAPTRDLAHDLPRHVTRFIGRERDVAAVGERLDAHALVTVTGVGGSGKSRVAAAVAETVLPRLRDGIAYVDLAPLTDASLVLPAALRALGARERSDLPPRDALAAAVRERDLLILVDNGEHLLAATAQLVRLLLGSGPGVKVLATSREALRIDGEAVYPLAPLDLPDTDATITVERVERVDAVRLFCDRAGLAAPGFRLTPENVGVIVTICRRLDGLPLALELAAGRVGSLPPAELAERIETRLDVVGRRRPAPGERHQTLLATIDWSHDLLDDSERAVFRRLAIFRGGWSAEAAEHVCAGGDVHPSDVLDILTTLVEKSLVVIGADGEEAPRTRYGLLDTLRLYATERLEESGEHADVAARHREHFLALALDPDGVGMPFTRRLAREMSNFRLALDDAASPIDTATGLAVCARLAPVWELSGDWFEGRRQLDRFLGRDDAGGAGPALCAAHYWAGKLAKDQADFDAASTHFEACRRLAASAGDDARVADARQGLGNVAEHRGDVEAALAHYEDALSVARRLEDPHRIAIALGNLGVVAKDRGDLPGARARYQQALTLFRELGDRRSTAIALNNLGVVAYLEQDLASARRHAEEALAIRIELGDRAGIASSQHNRGEVELDCGEHAAAAASFLAALEVRVELGERLFAANTLLGLADVVRHTGALEQATRLLAQAHATYETIGAELDTDDQRRAAACRAALEAALAPEALEAAWMVGRSRTLEQTLEALRGAESGGA